MNSKARTVMVRCAFLILGVWLAAPASADSPAVIHGAANLPIPCAGGCGATNLSWTSAPNVATWNYAGNDTSKMVVTQQADKAILNWASFNIGRNNSLQFDQPRVDSQVLNRIYGADPTNIAGKLTANGQVYLLNQNGIVFKNGAQINVGGLVASTLVLNDDVFTNGFLSVVTNKPIFEGGGAANIAVEKGAILQSGPGGRVMLVAPNVTNEGVIKTPDGQTILAAGAKAYVESGGDLGIRGLVVEVDGGGKVVNLGDILVGKGDAELVGLAVQQAGRISALTSVSANGTIRLLARDTVVDGGGGSGSFLPKAIRGGDLELGEHSLTEVLPDLEDKTTSVDDQVFASSEIQLKGKRIELGANARVVAPAGNVDMLAAHNPSAPNNFAGPEIDATKGEGSLVGIHLGKNAVIDVSGTTSTGLAMARNLVDLELRANELKDSPLQRDGVLRGKKVTVDIRTVDATGHIPLADISGAIGLIGRTVEERSAVGGTISLNSHGEVTAAPSSRLDVSGGSIRYDGGNIATTKIVAVGKVFDIANAPANVIYDGILGDDATKSDKWRVNFAATGNRGYYEAGYVEGNAAGSIDLVAPIFKWNGDLKGSRVLGAYQRELASLPAAGKLTIGWAPAQGNAVADFVTGPVNLQARTDLQTGSNSFNTGMLRSSGLGDISIYSNGAITLEEGSPMVLPTGGRLTLQASRVEVLSDVFSSSGTVDIQSRGTVLGAIAGFGAVSIGTGTRISTAGMWTNELPHAGGQTSPALGLNGGSIKLSAAQDLSLAEGSVLDVQGGAWLRGDGSLLKGKGGAISLATKSLDSKFLLGSQLLGFGFGTGGTLSLTTTKIDIVPQVVSDIPHLQFTPAFFGAHGFSNINLVANAGDLVLADGVQVAPQLPTRVLRDDFRQVSSGADLGKVGSLSVLPDDLRLPINLAFGATSAAPSLLAKDYGKVLLGSGAKIVAEPGATVNLSSNFQLEVLGEIRAPAGSIALKVNPVVDGQKGDDLYHAQQGLRLGSNSVLAVNGIERLRRNGVFSLRTVEDAGSVSLLASAGYIVMEPGARIDVSGVGGTADVVVRGSSLPQAFPLAGRAGRVTVKAAEALFLNGEFRAQAPNAQTPGGEVELDFGRGPSFSDPTGTFPLALRQLELWSGPTGGPNLERFGSLPDPFSGVGRINVSGLQAAGFDSVRLHSDDLIRVGSDLDWHVPGSLTLDVSRLVLQDGVVAAIGANYLSVGNSVFVRQQNAPVPEAGDAKLSLHGQWVDVVGNFVADRIGTMTLTADRDLRLIGVLGAGTTTAVTDAAANIVSPLYGKLTLAGDMNIEAGRVYPATLTDFTIEATGLDTRKIRFDGLPNAGAEVLSAGGRLTVKAPVIEQFGDIRAPQGVIELVAKNRLELGPDSTTSVAGGSMPVPFGSLNNGKEWVYNFGSGGTAVVTVPPEKRVALTAPLVAVAAGAVIDVSGGGDLSAFEFLPGPGGSKDVLADLNIYAVLPALGNGLAPYDFQFTQDANFSANRVVHFSGVPGLADGSYTLLPAHYGLLPGAFLVSKVGGMSGLIPGSRVAQTDGSVLVAGRSTLPGSLLLDDKWSTFRVSPGSVARQQSEFVEKTASALFADSPRTGGMMLPADAGSVAVSALNSLRMDGVIRADHEPSAHGARVDILAPIITIIGAGAQAPVPALGELVLDAGTIARFGAEDLLLGGLRHYGGSGVAVDVGAARVVLEPNVTLQGETITLVANDEIRLEHGSQLHSVGQAKNTDEQTWIIGRGGNGDGALLQVASGANTRLARENTARVSGGLVLGQDSLVQGNSVILDVTGSMRVDGDVQASDSLDIGVPRLLFGAAPTQTEGTFLPTALTGNWTTLSQVALRSYSSIDFYGDVSLGSSLLKKLILQSPVLRAAGTAGAQDVRLAASELTLRGGEGSLDDQTVTGDKKLTINATRLKLVGGKSLVEGFSSVTFDAATEVVAAETGSLQTQGDLSISAPVITTGNGVDYDISSRAGLEIHGKTPIVERPQGLGGKLTLTAARLVDDGLIDVPSGYVNMTATGPGGLTVGSHGVVQVAGQHRPLLDGAAFETPGGNVVLLAAQGDLAVDSAAVIDVSGAGEGADAGRVEFSAPNGILNIAGTLKGMAGVGGRGGEAKLDARNIVDLAVVGQKLSNAGFSGAQSYRQRDSDIRIDSAATVAAGILLFAADNGAITVDGTLNAARPRGGSVRLVAKNDVSVTAGGLIRATASNADAAGVVELESNEGWVRIAQGSRIVAGSAETGGVVRLIASRPIGEKIRVSAIPHDSFANVADLAVVGMINESDKIVSGQINANTQSKIQADLVGFGTGLADQRKDLGADGLPALRVVPGVRIDALGDLKLAADWDFAKWRYGDVATGAEAGLLFLRAGGDLILNGSLSDGFDVTTSNKTGTLKLGPSWSYRVVAGADMGAADPMAFVGTPDTGTLTVGSSKWVRTGQGEIRLAAARDLVLAGSGNTGAVIYTAGTPAVPLSGFTEPSSIAYPELGGDIDLQAGRDIRSQPTSQLYTQWMPRLGKDGATWGVSFADFHQGVAALAGGNVAAVAGRDIVDLSVSVPTIGRSVPSRGVYSVGNSGDINITAGGNLSSDLFYVGRGSLTARAGGAIGRNPDRTSAGGVSKDSGQISALLAVGQGLVDVRSRGGVTVESVINPTVLAQGKAVVFTSRTNFLTYDENTTVSISSLAGNVDFLNNSPRYYDTGLASSDNKFPVYPPSLTVSAPIGDIVINGTITMIPSQAGQLRLLAGHDIALDAPGINMSDADPGLLPWQSSPRNQMTDFWLRLAPYGSPDKLHSRNPVHIGDLDPVFVAAGNDITGGIYVPKALRVTAGRDIINLDARAQNLAVTDVSEINAGRDLVFRTTRDSQGRLESNYSSITIDGPGKLFVLAGRNIDLGASSGIVSGGNLSNPGLAEHGADILVYAGLAANYVDWLQQTIQPKTDMAASSAEVQQLLAFVSQRLGRTVTDPVDAWSEFMAMPAVVQRPLVLEFIADQSGQTSGSLEQRLEQLGVEFAKNLVEAGKAHNAGGDYSIGWDAIKNSFPGNGYLGDLNLYLSKIKTEDGGDIRLFVPGGMLNVGVANASSGQTKEASELGIVAQDLGRISIFVSEDVLVNQSRVFTLKGGDILVWSSGGSIDAGRGAKSAVSAPAPTVTINPDGTFKFTYAGAVAGSGIRIINTDPSIVSGRVDLVAPKGSVNAGDAGIGSAGTLNIAAVSVTGADNIQVSGTSTGVPTTDVGSLSVGFAGQADASASAAKGVQESLGESAAENSTTPQADRALAYLEVMIQGFGGDEANDSSDSE